MNAFLEEFVREEKEKNKRNLIIIESEKLFENPNSFCKKNKCNHWYMFTDILTESTGLISKKNLNKNYKKMDNLYLNKKQMYRKLFY
jgi:hypothetical protein